MTVVQVLTTLYVVLDPPLTYQSLSLANTRKYVRTLGDGVADTFTVEHRLATEDVVVAIREATGDKEVLSTGFTWKVLSSMAIEVQFTTAPALNEYRIVIQG